jgi:signal transduction histidine kinase
LVHFQIYKDKVGTLQNTIYSQMQIASLNLESRVFKLEFVKKTKDKELYKLQKDNTNVFAFFEIFGSNKFFSKVSYPVESLNNDIKIIKKDIYIQIFQALLITFIISILFSLYALQPIKQSLKMTNEFIKDILHDFNTPISTIRLNIDLLKNQESKAIQRIKSGITTILNLQNNLKNYIDDEIGEKEECDLKEILTQRVELMQGTYPNIKINLHVENCMINCNKDGMIRIIDNIISNSCKYNKVDGKVFISFKNNILKIQDTGIGIKHPKRIFERFYKETSRGLGIGLHIVHKLSKKMNIQIEVKSEINQGTTFNLNLSSLTLL